MEKRGAEKVVAVVVMLLLALALLLILWFSLRGQVHETARRAHTGTQCLTLNVFPKSCVYSTNLINNRRSVQVEVARSDTTDIAVDGVLLTLSLADGTTISVENKTPLSSASSPQLSFSIDPGLPNPVSVTTRPIVNLSIGQEICETGYQRTQCEGTQCGNGQLEIGEVCDSDIGELCNYTYSDNGFTYPGLMACNPTCTGMECSTSASCGDGEVNGYNETCDFGADSDTCEGCLWVCADGRDNDGDGKIDFGTDAGNDDGCWREEDDETPAFLFISIEKPLPEIYITDVPDEFRLEFTVRNESFDLGTPESVNRTLTKCEFYVLNSTNDIVVPTTEIVSCRNAPTLYNILEIQSQGGSRVNVSNLTIFAAQFSLEEVMDGESYRVVVNVSDETGDVESESKTFRIFRGVEITSPKFGTRFGSLPVEVNFTTLFAPAACEYRLNNGRWKSIDCAPPGGASPPYNFSFLLNRSSGYTQKFHNLTLKVTDPAGEDKLVKHMIIFDRCPGDINRNGQVLVEDLSNILSVSSDPPQQQSALLANCMVSGMIGCPDIRVQDFNLRVDIIDIVIFVQSYFGQTYSRDPRYCTDRIINPPGGPRPTG